MAAAETPPLWHSPSPSLQLLLGCGLLPLPFFSKASILYKDPFPECSSLASRKGMPLPVPFPSLAPPEVRTGWAAASSLKHTFMIGT